MPTPYVPPVEDLPPGSFVRGPYLFRDWVTRDDSSGYPAEPGRYHLYIQWACPWAQRAAIVRELLGLQDAVSMSSVHPVRDERGWAFTDEADPVNGFSYLSEAYVATDPGYRGMWTVPVLWDRVTSRIVSNNFHDITVMLVTQFPSSASVDLLPTGLADAIASVNETTYLDVNNGVYKCGFASTQAAYDHAVRALFARLEEYDVRLSGQRYLMGDRLTMADVHLFTTLVRFDAVYHTHFKCNRRRLVDHPHLWPYARDLYQRDGFGSTTRFDDIVAHYYLTHPHLNPSRIVPMGPDTDWDEPHGRDAL